MQPDLLPHPTHLCTSNTDTILMFQPLHIKTDHRLPATDLLPIHQEVLSKIIIRHMPVTCVQAWVMMCPQTFILINEFMFEKLREWIF